MNLLNQSEVLSTDTESLAISDKSKFLKRLELCHAKPQTRGVRV